MRPNKRGRRRGLLGVGVALSLGVLLVVVGAAAVGQHCEAGGLAVVPPAVGLAVLGVLLPGQSASPVVLQVLPCSLVVWA